MAAKKKNPFFNTFKGQSFHFHGSFSRDKTKLADIVQADGGKVLDPITDKLTYLVQGDSRAKGLTSAQKKVAKLNAGKGSIIEITEDQLIQMLTPDKDAYAELMAAGEAGSDRLTHLCSYPTRVEIAFKFTGEDFSGKAFQIGENDHSHYEDCDFTGAHITGGGQITMSNCKFDKATFNKSPRGRHNNVLAVHIKSASDCSFKQSQGFLSLPEAIDCTFETTELVLQRVQVMKSCEAPGAKFPEIELYGIEHCNFDRAVLDGGRIRTPYSFRGSKQGLSDSSFKKTSFKQLSLEKTTCTRIDATASDWLEADLKGTSFIDCKLGKASFKDAELMDVDFGNSDLSGVSFEGATLLRVSLDQAKLRGASFKNTRLLETTPTDQQIKQVKHWKDRQVLASAGPLARKLAKVKADNIKTRITLKDEAGETAELWVEVYYPNYGTDYRYGLQKPGQNVYKKASSFTNAFTELALIAKEMGSIQANTIRASGTKSAVKGKDLKALCLSVWYEALEQTPPSAEDQAASEKAAKEKASAARKKKSGRKAELVALLDGKPANTKKWNAATKDVAGIATFHKVAGAEKNFTGIKFVGLDMRESNFEGAKLTRASLSGSRMRKCNFNGADLKQSKGLGYASFQDSTFVGADLSKANFTGAELNGADLSDAKLDEIKLKQASFDEKTRWPKGFTPPADMDWEGKGPHPGKVAAVKKKRKSSGPIDLATFHNNVAQNADAGRLKKALSMLKKDAFQLFIEVDDDGLAGVVKSQTDKSLVYSCSIKSNGSFACCTQNLNVCGGLRGALCKHLLVLIMGIAKAEEVDADALDTWVKLSLLQKPDLDKDAMSAILLKYKGAEAGEIDWRPTETVPEDYYVL